VNVPSLDSETRKQLQPLLFLAQRLGKFQSLYMQGKPTAVEVVYAGDIGVTDTYPITAAILTGFLEPLVETVNSVSAPHMLKERGIEFRETRSAQPSDYAFTIGVNVTTDSETHRIAGTLFGKDDPRICILDGTRVDAKPEGWMVVCMNEDKPLIIGRVATALGEAGINIANLMLGRDERGGRASTILNVDEPVPDEIMERIRKVPHVKQARLVALS
jgi:D-3-phosphoglycerate dehydrogenase